MAMICEMLSLGDLSDYLHDFWVLDGYCLYCMGIFVSDRRTGGTKRNQVEILMFLCILG